VIPGLPVLSFQFANNTIVEWQPAHYIYHIGNSEICLAIGDSGRANEAVLGAAWFVGRNVIFDLEKNIFGIATANCPRVLFANRPPTNVGDQVDLKVNNTTVKNEVMEDPVANTVIESLDDSIGLVNMTSVETLRDDKPVPSSKTDSVQESSSVDGLKWIVILLCICLIVCAIIVWKKRESKKTVIARTTYAAVIELEESPVAMEVIGAKNIGPISP
jgi:hypothetical protein